MFALVRPLRCTKGRGSGVRIDCGNNKREAHAAWALAVASTTATTTQRVKEGHDNGVFHVITIIIMTIVMIIIIMTPIIMIVIIIIITEVICWQRGGAHGKDNTRLI